MVELRIGSRLDPHSNVSTPNATRSSREILTQFLASPESGELSAFERRELNSLTREVDAELFHSGLYNLAGRVENRNQAGLATRLYSLVQSQSEDSPLRNRAQRRLAVLEGGGSFGERAEFLARNFIGQATEPTAIVAMGVGGMAFRAARLGLLGRLISNPAAGLVTRGFGARALASTGAFLAESTTFTLTGRGLHALMGRSQDWSLGSLGQEWAAGALTLASLRGFGAAGNGLYRRVHGPVASPWQGLYAQTAMYGGILTAHYAEGRLGLRQPLSGSNALLDGFVTLLQFNVAGRLSREAFGRNWQAWERGLDIQAERLNVTLPQTGGSGFGALGLGPRLAFAQSQVFPNRAAEGILMMEGRQNEGAEKPEAPANGSGTPRAKGTEPPAPASEGEEIPSWWPTREVLPQTLRNFIDALPDSAVVFEFVPGENKEGLLGRILMANRRVHDKFGYTQEEAVGLPLSKFTHPDDGAIMSRIQQSILQTNRIKFREVRFVRKDGSVLYCDISGNIQRSGDRSIGFAILQDVSQRRLAQAQVQAERARFRALLKGVPDVMLRITKDGEIVDAHYERPENFIVPLNLVIGSQVTNLPAPPHLIELAMTTMQRALDTGEPQLAEYILPMPDGTHRIQEGRMMKSGEDEIVATIRDITEARQAEGHRIAAARAETFKLMGRGLAHDANGALTPLLLLLEVSRKTLQRVSDGQRTLSTEDLQTLTEDIKTAAQSATRIQGLIANFRELSTEPQSGPAFDLHSLLRASDIRGMVGPDLPLRLRLSGEPWLVPGPKENINRVIQNLATNARDAMEGEQGLLHIETTRVVLSSEDLRQMASYSPGILNHRGGNFMRLRVQDNGLGISPENIQRIFEPYFSTKSTNDGAGHGGLGLALTQKMVQDAGGFITVESSPQGTTFDVYLPQADQVQSADTRANILQAHGKPLLIVSPNQDFRESLQAAMVARGFSQVLTAQSFEEAQALAQTHGELGGLLTEFRLPGNLYGVKLMQSLRQTRPDLPAILLSEHDGGEAYSIIMGQFGKAVERNTSPNELGAIAEDLISRRLRQ